MFKCWNYISGQTNSIHKIDEHLSDKDEEYSKINKQEGTQRNKESALIESYFSGTRKLEFLNRFINFP